MTAARVHHLADLPDMAYHPAVTVVYERGLELDTCEICTQEALSDPTLDIPKAVWRVSWRFAPGKAPHTTDVCGRAHAEDELSQLVGWKGTCDVTLHLPTSDRLPSDPPSPRPAPVAAEDDFEFQLYHSLLKLFETMPNTATVDMSGRDGFEHARSKIRAHLAQLGLNRIEQLAVAS